MSSFRKVMVTGARSAQEMMREIDPTINAIEESTKGMTEALAHPPPAKKRRGRPPAIGASDTTSTAALGKYNENLERLRMLKTHFDSSYDPLVALLTSMTASNAAAPTAATAAAAPVIAPPAPIPTAHRPPPAPAPAPATPPPPADDDDDELAPPPPRSRERGKPFAPKTPAPKEGMATASTMTVMAPDEILQGMQENLPGHKKKKYDKLMKFIKDNPDVLGVDAKGRAVIRGTVLPGTNFKEIAKSMFTLNNKSHAPAGLGTVLAEMKAAGLSPQAIVSNAARGIYYESPQGALPDKESGMTQLGQSGAFEIKDTPTPHASKSKAMRSKHMITGLNDSTNKQQDGSGDIMKMLPGRPVKMLRLYD